jgi:iron complex transport system substrate-binding protein
MWIRPLRAKEVPWRHDVTDYSSVPAPSHLRGIFVTCDDLEDVVKTYFALVLSGFALIIAACGSAPAAQPVETPAPIATDAPATEPTLESTVAPTTAPAAQGAITDGAGRSVEIPAEVNRVVSLAPSTTEIVYALGAGDRMVAVDMYSDYPAEVADLTKITNPDMSVNYEQISALEPDVVFAAAITAPDVITQLETLGMTVVVVGSFNSTFASVLNDIKLVGTVLGLDGQAIELTSTMQVDWDTLVNKVAELEERPRVFWELDATDPAKPYTIGAGTFVDELLIAAGGVNVFGQSENPYPQVSLEQIVAEAPEVILLANSIWGVTPDMVYARAGWEEIPAVKNQAVYPINDNLVSRPGPRIVEGLAEVVRVLHPNLP